MRQAFVTDCVVLQVSHHRVKLRHRVADGRSRCEDNASAVGHLVDIAAFQEHIRGLLCIGGRKSCDIPHFRVEEQILKTVCLVNIEAVNAELFKGDNIVLACAVLQFAQSRLQALFGSLQGLDCEAFCTACFEFLQTFFDFGNLLLQKPFLSLLRYGDALKLAVSDDDGIVVACGNSAAELLTVSRFKVLFRCGENVGRRVQTEKLACPLFGQVIWNDKQWFLAKSKPFALHRRRYHLEGLPCAYLVCKERVAAVENVGNGVLLMLTELDFGVHTAENDVRTVILTRAVRIEKLVILGDKLLPSVGVFPNPITKRILDCLLLLLSESGFLGIEHSAFTPIGVSNGVIDTNITQIQSILQNLIGIGSVRAVGHIGIYIAVGRLRFARDIPFRSERRVVDINTSTQIVRRFKGLHHKLLNVGLVNPCCTEADLNLGGIKVFGLRRFQSSYIVRNLVAVLGIIRQHFQCPLIVGELFTDITGQKIIGSSPSVRAVGLSVEVHIDNATQIVCQFVLGFASKRGHILHIHTGFLSDRDCQSFRGGVNGGYNFARLDCALCEHIRLAFEIVVLIEHFQGAEQIVGAVIGKGEGIATAVDKTVLCCEIVIESVQLSLGLSDSFIGDISVHLLTDELLHTIPQFNHTFHTLCCCSVKVGLYHAAVFTVINIAVYHGVAVILHIWVGRDRGVDGFAIAKVGQLRFGITALDVLNGIFELNTEVKVFIRFNREILSAVLCIL